MATFSSTSTSTPPKPQMITGPNIGSRLIPKIISTPSPAMRWTTTPSIFAEGTLAQTRSLICAKASRTAAPLVNLRTTPPTSLLWVICADSTLSTTGNPIFSAAAAASSALCASLVGRSGCRMFRTVERPVPRP